jgi:hypothetical protein
MDVLRDDGEWVTGHASTHEFCKRSFGAEQRTHEEGDSGQKLHPATEQL